MYDILYVKNEFCNFTSSTLIIIIISRIKTRTNIRENRGGHTDAQNFLLASMFVLFLVSEVFRTIFGRGQRQPDYLIPL